MDKSEGTNKKTHYINSLMMSQDTFGLDIEEIDFQKKYSIEEIKSYFLKRVTGRRNL